MKTKLTPQEYAEAVAVLNSDKSSEDMKRKAIDKLYKSIHSELTTSEQKLVNTFRSFAISRGFADKLVLDKPFEKANVSGVTGFYGTFRERRVEWVVYDTDEKAEIGSLSFFHGLEGALIEIAKRFNCAHSYITYRINHKEQEKLNE
jgi:hypothetical protein